MFGLRRGTVKISPYQKEWIHEFELEKKKLQSILGKRAVAIEHVGSTSVPGLASKPIVDIDIGIHRLKDAGRLRGVLAEIGYKFSREFPYELFLAKGSASKRTHYLHIVRYRGAKWTNDLKFRNYLRSNPSRKKQYATLKIRLGRIHANDRSKYTRAKSSFIKATLVKSK